MPIENITVTQQATNVVVTPPAPTSLTVTEPGHFNVEIATPGPQGAVGPAPVIDMGTVTTGAAGSSAAATITGTALNPLLNLIIPRGDTGETGDTGPVGPVPTLSSVVVTTGAAGSSASGAWSGTNPYTLNLTIPRGDTGSTGATGPAPTLNTPTVTALAVGATPTVGITGTNPYTIDFGIPINANWLNGTEAARTSGVGNVGDYYLVTSGTGLGDVHKKTDSTTWTLQGNIRGATGTGDLTGPVSSVDDELVVYSGTTGKIVKNSGGILYTDLVRLSQTQTITGAKTFSVAPVVPDASWTIAKTSGLQTALDAKYSPTNIPSASVFTTGTLADARLSTNVNLLNTVQTITGVKTFAPGVTGTPWSTIFTGGGASDGLAIRLGTSASYPHYLGSLFGTGTYGGIGTVMNDNGLQLTNIGGEFRVQTSPISTRKDVAYTSKTDGTKQFTFAADNDLNSVPPGSTFTVGAATYTVRSASNTTIRVVEDISTSPATGTLTQVLYAPVRFSISTAGTANFSGILQASGGLRLLGRTALDNSIGLSGSDLYFEGAAGRTMYFRPNGAGSNTGMLTISPTHINASASLSIGSVVSPASGYHLHIDAGTNSRGMIEYDNDASGFGDFVFTTNAGIDRRWAFGANSPTALGSAANLFYIFQYKNIAGIDQQAYRLTVNDSGFVGIGIGNATERLDVSGNIKTTGTVSGTGFIGSTDSTFTGKVAIGTAHASTVTALRVLKSYPATTVTGTNFYQTQAITALDAPISAGVTESGYRIGLAVEHFFNTAAFAGTLASQYGIWARVGSNSTNPTGTITTSYGIYIENLDSANVTVTNKYGVYQSNTTAKNYFGGNVNIGAENNSYKLHVAGTVNATGLITGAAGATITGTVTATTFSGSGSSITGVVHTTGNETITGDKTFSSSTIHNAGITIPGGQNIGMGSSGLGAPTFTTRSAGTKIMLWESVGAATSDYAIGIESGAVWFSVDTTAKNFKWYGGTTLAAWLTGTGNLTVVGSATATTFSGSGASLTALPAGQLTGTVATARLGSGTASSSVFLRGDQTWNAVDVDGGTP